MMLPEDWWLQQQYQQDAERMFGNQAAEALGYQRPAMAGRAVSRITDAAKAVQRPTMGAEPKTSLAVGVEYLPAAGPWDRIAPMLQKGATALGAGAAGLAAYEQARRGETTGAMLSGAQAGLQGASLIPGTAATLQALGGPLGLMAVLHGSRGLAEGIGKTAGRKAPQYAAESTLLSGLGGVGTGVMAGAPFGPVGMGVGGGLGLLAGSALPAAVANKQFGSKFWKAAGESSRKKVAGAEAGSRVGGLLGLPGYGAAAGFLGGEKLYDKLKDKIKDLF